MRVAAVQHDIFWEDRSANHARLKPMIEGAVATGARLIVLPERFAVGSADPHLAESEDGPSIEFLVEMATATKSWICGSVDIEYSTGVVTTAVLVGPDGSVHRTRALREDEDEATLAEPKLNTFTCDDLRVTPVPGCDLFNPHEFWVVAADTDVFVVPGAEPESRRRKWQVLLAARAIENQCYVVGANRVGTGGGVNYAGDSRIIDPSGSVLTSGWGAETILFAEVDSALVRFTRDRNPMPGGDRRAAVITLP